MPLTRKSTWFVVLSLLSGCGGSTSPTPADAGGRPEGPCSADSGTVPAGDGCNTCICTDEGTWACTDIACPPKACTPGETKSDGCNSCSCSAEGKWACTLIACIDAGPPSNARCGARAGATCKPYEYCAYEAGESCGAADRESVCKLRPTECDLKLSPVCGCDQKTYDNACLAASAGTGVLQNGACP
jgi:Pacifastin inhibitor (LCMII)/Kazal-type serine protease inhibitor domain